MKEWTAYRIQQLDQTKSRRYLCQEDRSWFYDAIKTLQDTGLGYYKSWSLACWALAHHYGIDPPLRPPTEYPSFVWGASPPCDTDDAQTEPADRHHSLGDAWCARAIEKKPWVAPATCGPTASDQLSVIRSDVSTGHMTPR